MTMDFVKIINLYIYNIQISLHVKVILKITVLTIINNY